MLAARFAVESVSGRSTFAELDRASLAVAGGLAALDSSDALEVGFLTLHVHGSWFGGDEDEARRAGRRLVALAERAGEPATYGEAVAVVTGPPVGRDRPDPLGLLADGPTDDNRSELLERCLSRFDGGDPLGAALAVRARRLGRSGFPSPQWWRAQLAAVDGAGADGAAVAHVTELARFLLERGAGPVRETVARLLASAADGDEDHLALAGRRLEFLAALEAGHRSPASLPLPGVLCSTTTPVEVDVALLAVTVDLVGGRLQRAAGTVAALTTFAHSRSRPLGPALDAHRLVLAWDEGRPLDHEPRSVVVAALMAAEAGDRHRAGRLLDEALASDELRPDPCSLAPAAMVAAAAHRSGHAEAAQAAWRVLHLECATTPVTLGPGVTVLGPAGYFAGLAAATSGRVAKARALLAGAEAWSRAVDARPALVRALAASAELAALEHDRDGAERRLAEAQAVAVEIGLGWLELRPSR